jgi:hypothetical protein
MPETVLQYRCFDTGNPTQRNHKLEVIEGLNDIAALLSVLRIAADSYGAAESNSFELAVARVAHIGHELALEVTQSLHGLGFEVGPGCDVVDYLNLASQEREENEASGPAEARKDGEG